MAPIHPASTQETTPSVSAATSDQWPAPAGPAPAQSALMAQFPEGSPAVAATALALLRACRPRQWTKNLLVLAAPGAAGVLLHADVPGQVAVAFFSFCLLSSCTYLLNDVHDRHEDARNPRKQDRPIASGQVSSALAVAAALALAVTGLGLAAAVRPGLVGVGAGYLALTGAYTLWLRNVEVADIVVVAGCFVVRAIAGGVATAVPVSRWFVIVTCFGALFLVAGKRYAELQAVGAAGDASQRSLRPSLRAYSERYLQFVMMLAAAVAIGAYCLWAFQRRGGGVAPWYDVTILPFVIWMLRYALLVDQGAGYVPEELVLGDRFLLTMSLSWTALFAGAVYVGG